MIVVRYLTKIYATDSYVALSTYKDVHSLVCILDESKDCLGWQIVGTPNLQDIGWDPVSWNKHRPYGFKEEAYGNV